MSFAMLYVTCADQNEAERLSNAMLEDRIVACTNIYSMNSHFWWQGELSREDELVVIMKTRESLVKIVESKIIELHSYDTPCIIHWTVSANESYEKWIEKETCGAITDH